VLCRSVRQAMEVASFRVRLQTLLDDRRLRSRSDYLTLARRLFHEQLWGKSTKRHRRDLRVEGIRLWAGSLRSPGGVRIAPQNRHVDLSQELIWRVRQPTRLAAGNCGATPRELRLCPACRGATPMSLFAARLSPLLGRARRLSRVCRPTILVTCLENPAQCFATCLCP